MAESTSRLGMKLALSVCVIAFVIATSTLKSADTPLASIPDDWAFREIKRSPIPNSDTVHRDWVRTPIDAFILKSMLEKGLKPSPEANRRTLFRRVSLDLTGLPPLPEAMEEFLNDPAPDAYEKRVEQLLASPRYGERWARHWLDVAHYADSHGQDQDRPRPNSWPYRDYLIRSFNEDKPYSQFVREQVAGDVLDSSNPQAIVATGFLAAGPWDESGLRDIQENSLDRQIARYLDRDDIVTTTMSTFAGLTAHCARCHDHKFDPITQEDYFSLQAVFAGIDKAERNYDVDPQIAEKRTRLGRDLQIVKGLKGKADPILLATDRLAAVKEFEKEYRSTGNRWEVALPISVVSKAGSEFQILPDQSVLARGMRPDRDTYTEYFQTTTKMIRGLRLEVMSDSSLPHRGPGRQDNGNLHLSEIRVFVQPKGKPDQRVAVKLISSLADFDQLGWGIGRAIDGDATTAWGIYPEVGKSHQAVFEFSQLVNFENGAEFQVELDQQHGGGHLIGRFRISLTTGLPMVEGVSNLPSDLVPILNLPVQNRSSVQQAEVSRWVWERNLERELASLPAQAKVYCGTNRFAVDGSFRPSPTPRPIHVLKRGEITRPQQLVSPGAIAAISVLKSRFAIPDPNDEGQRRAALAEWLTDPKNPLTWRVIVNRVWHYHFGRGIVDTPNDFGKMGGRPTHPELLDWLATDFREHGGSLKRLHRMIVTSSVYRQQVTNNTEASMKDADNRLLWRMNRGRLDAETIRDSILFVSGRLNDQMTGPPIKHFLMKPGIHVTPEADYDRFDLDATDARRRSIYRYIFRTRPDPMLEALDCPDASQSAPVRSASLSAPQALVMWNNKFTLRHSEHLGEMASRAKSDSAEQIRWLTQRVLCRQPTVSELRDWSEFSRKHGLPNLCRVLFNSTEFLFID